MGQQVFPGIKFTRTQTVQTPKSGRKEEIQK